MLKDAAHFKTCIISSSTFLRRTSQGHQQKMAKLGLLFLWVFMIAKGVTSSRLKLYDNQSFNNLIYDKEVGTDCINLREVDDKASSVTVDNYGTSVNLYADFFCTGRRILAYPGVPIQNLDNLNFDNVISSVRASCPPIPGNTDCCSVSGNNTLAFQWQKAKLLIFDNYDHQDLIDQLVPIEECYNLDKVNNRASSVVTGGTCVILYDDMDCSGSHITVFPGSKYHYNLSELNFDNKLSSVRACCEQRNWTGFNPNSPIIPGIE